MGGALGCSRSWIIYALGDGASARLFLGLVLGRTLWIIQQFEVSAVY